MECDGIMVRRKRVDGRAARERRFSVAMHEGWMEERKKTSRVGIYEVIG